MTFSALFEPREGKFHDCTTQVTEHFFTEGHRYRDIAWILRGPKGATTFQVSAYTPPPGFAIQFPHIGAHDPDTDTYYMPSIVAWHDPQKPDEGSYDSYQESCFALDGVPCYTSGTGLLALDLLRTLHKTPNENIVWSALLYMYRSHFISEELT
jgi:hypothetical protein